ncbi:hypothetical protein P7C70_g2063, partial [Phenoliferia sp. Uapishka_3]
MTAPTISFTYLLSTLQADAEVREKIKEAVKALESGERECLAVLNRVHVVGQEDVLHESLHLASLLAITLLDTITPRLPTLRSAIAHLASLVPPSQFYRYNDSFSKAIQSAAFIVVFDKFLRTEEVASKEEVAEALGSKSALGF